jgi:4'-phosphopantetheinyl transferase
MTTTLAGTAAPIRIWHASTSHVFADPDRARRALTWLAPHERDRYSRFRVDVDRRMFLLGRVMSRALVGQALGVAPTDWRWQEGPRGRPEIADPATQVRFNLAHSAGLVVCALAADREVGVDVEDLQRPETDPAIVARYCTPREAAAVAAPSEGWRNRFLEYWTLKEAYLKARGLGLVLPLAEVGFVHTPHGIRPEFLGSLAGTDDRWAFHLERITDRHLLAVAAPTDASASAPGGRTGAERPVASPSGPAPSIAALPMSLLP